MAEDEVFFVFFGLVRVGEGKKKKKTMFLGVFYDISMVFQDFLGF